MYIGGGGGNLTSEEYSNISEFVTLDGHSNGKKKGFSSAFHFVTYSRHRVVLKGRRGPISLPRGGY